MLRATSTKSQIFAIPAIFLLLSACSSSNVCEEARTEKEAINMRCQQEAETEGTPEPEDTEGPVRGILDCPDVSIPYYKCELACHQEVRTDGEYGCDPVLDPQSEKAQAYKDCLKDCEED